jgi:hypothetical protein
MNFNHYSRFSSRDSKMAVPRLQLCSSAKFNAVQNLSLSLPAHSMLELSWAKWYCDRFLYEIFGFSLSVSFHRSSTYSYIIWGSGIQPGAREDMLGGT